jgi:hypothetical protein
MFKNSLLLIVLIIFLFIFPASQSSSAEFNGADTAQVKVDIHWIDVYQRDTGNILEVDEYFFINNTGMKTFDDDIDIWLHSNSKIIAKCCGNAPEMACKFNGGGSMSCFSMFNNGGNQYSGKPTLGQDTISYFGQKAQLKLEINSQEDLSKNGELLLDLELGGSTDKRDTQTDSEDKIQLSSEHSKIGFVPNIAVEMPNNISRIERIKIFNNDNKTLDFNFTISGLPEGWRASLIKESDELDSITLGPDETRDISLEIRAPSYIAPFEVSYITTIKQEGEENIKANFNKKYIYDTNRLEYYIYARSGNDLELSPDLRIVHPSGNDEPIWNDENARLWYIIQANNLGADAQSKISFKWKEPKDSSMQVINIVFILLIIIIITIPILRIKGYIGKKKHINDLESSSDKPETGDFQDPGSENSSTQQQKLLEKERKKYLSIIARVKSDLNKGYLDKSDAENIIARYKIKLEKNNENLDELILLNRAEPTKLKSGREKPQTIKSKKLDKNTNDSDEILILHSTKRAKSKSVQKKQQMSNNKNTKESLSLKNIEEIEMLILKLKKDRDNGLLPDEIYNDLSKKYDNELKNIRKQLDSKNQLLKLKRDQMNHAIESLDEEYKNGNINEIVYNKLVSDYTKHIEIFETEINDKS